MKGSKLLSVAIALAMLLALSAGLSVAQRPAPQGPGSPQAMVGSTFTYQGQLLKDGNPVNDTCEMDFSLYDDASAGSLVGDPVTQTVTVADGLFTVPLDFGSDVFTGDARWLEVAVQCTGDAGFNTLAPRQELTAAPYALSLRPGAIIAGTLGMGNVLSVINSNTTLNPAVGVYGESASPFYGYGVYGYASATSSDWAAGVYGEVESPNGAGVYGYGPIEGVYGRASAGPPDTTYGVYGRSDATRGRGVYGYASSTEGWPFGVYGESESTGGFGVFGYSPASEGYTYGVYGVSQSPDGCGVYGVNMALSGQTYGVFGSTVSGDGYGVYCSGDFAATGSKAAIVQTQAYGWRHLYAVESPDVLFEDVGTAQLVDGQAIVTIDPIFAQTVNLEQPYHVFLTPRGQQFVLLLVTATDRSGFTVQGVTLDGRPATCTFDYRIIAKRLGYEDTRLAPASDPAQMEEAVSHSAAPEEQP